MRWTVETLNKSVDAEIEALPKDMRARLVRLTQLIQLFGFRGLPPDSTNTSTASYGSFASPAATESHARSMSPRQVGGWLSCGSLSRRRKKRPSANWT